MTTRRCCNIDWLEVHCYEPSQEPRDARYYRTLGYDVEERSYGTRVYKEMFTVRDSRGHDFVEVRRNPFSQGFHGLFTAEDCHLRLVNAACYHDEAVNELQQFMQLHGYTFHRIVRVDICLDFERFDRGDEPAAFVRRYFNRVYSKINQGTIRSYGKDTWHGQDWNSLSWGSPTSDVSTKLYDKTMELYDPKSDTYSKPHIRYAWLLCGLIDDFHRCTKTAADGTVYKPRIWRVEFSIRSSVKKWYKIELDGKSRKYQSIRNTLDMYDNRPKLVTMFAALQRHYFRFKYFQEDQRKDRCPDKVLFVFDKETITYKVDKTSDATPLLGDGKQSKPLDSLAKRLRIYAMTHPADKVQTAVQTLIASINDDTIRADAANPWNRAEVLALQHALRIKQDSPNLDVAVLLREIKKYLHINDLTAIF